VFAIFANPGMTSLAVLGFLRGLVALKFFADIAGVKFVAFCH
jgi:hypothetical protein